MSYVGAPFEHDLFISYSHGDVDGGGQSRLKQWSQGFVRELESELRTLPRFGRTLSLFLDQHHRPAQGLDPMAPLSGQLQDDIGGAALLTLLMSPHYLASKWCADERAWWLDAQHRVGLPAEGRVAVARIWPTDAAQWPAEIKDAQGHALIGFPFHDPSQADTHPQPYEWPEPDAKSKGEFRRMLIEMVARLAPKLDEIKAALDLRRRAQAEAQKLSAPGGQAIYLYGREQYEQDWSAAWTTLSNEGYAVLPTEPDRISSDPEEALSLRRSRIEKMSGCDALLLLGCGEPDQIEADLISVGKRDRGSAQDQSRRLLPCGLLNRGGELVATPKRRIAARALQVDWIDPQHDPWTADVRDWLHRRAAAAGAQA